MAALVQLAAAAILAAPVVAGSIADIEHVVLFMQGASPFTLRSLSFGVSDDYQKIVLSIITSVPWLACAGFPTPTSKSIRVMLPFGSRRLIRPRPTPTFSFRGISTIKAAAS